MFKINGLKYPIALGVAFTATLLAYIWFSDSRYFAIFSHWTENNLPFLYFSVFFIKILGVIWPPLPGGVFTIAMVSVVGWFKAYILDLVATIIGSSITFYLGKNFGWGFLKKFLSFSAIENIKNIRIKENRQVESVLVLRIFGGVLVDLVSYAAGLFKVGYYKFMVGCVLSHLATVMPAYFLFGNILSGNNLILASFSLIILIPLFWKMKDRYLEQTLKVK